jgi:hypothetical protein
MQAISSNQRQIDQPGWCAIVGAPRCGTTSLGRYLKTHPDVCFSSIKEPHFFSTRDLGEAAPSELRRAQENYLDSFFPGRRPGDVLAEASVSYLYAPERVSAAIKLWPDARFVIAVRSPLELLPSLHLRNVHNGDETERDFERAWNLVEERRDGRHVPRSCIDRRLLDYKEIGSLGKHVRRFVDIVGRERCFISVFDDIVADSAGLYGKVIDFLGLPEDCRTSFPVHRPSTDVKAAWLQRFLKRPPGALRALGSPASARREGAPAYQHFASAAATRHLMQIRKHLLGWNRVRTRPAGLNAHLRRALSDYYREDIAQLSSLLGRDLSHWLSPRSIAVATG